MQAAPAAASANPYGLVPALEQGGIIAFSVFAILVIMSLGTFYILFTKLMQQQKIMSQGRKVRASFWNSPNLREASTKLEAKSAYRAIVDDALVAQDQHGKLTTRSTSMTGWPTAWRAARVQSVPASVKAWPSS